MLLYLWSICGTMLKCSLDNTAESSSVLKSGFNGHKIFYINSAEKKLQDLLYH